MCTLKSKVLQMIDKELNRYTSGHLDRIANVLYEKGVDQNWVTLLGLALAFLCFVVLSFGLFYLGLILILINRFLDGLDGSLATTRHAKKVWRFF